MRSKHIRYDKYYIFMFMKGIVVGFATLAAATIEVKQVDGQELKVYT